MSILYLVATPIGNLEDISLRALRILGEVRLIAAEDTRHTGKLLQHFDISTPMVSYHEYSQAHKREQILHALQQGDVAVVSDAGTPALNDPGYELVVAAIEAGIEVSPIPGPSAPIAALIASGLPTTSFLYLGYLPRKSGERRITLEDVAGLSYTLIFLETPHRLLKSLEDIKKILGNRRIAVARELTKMHEDIFRGNVDSALVHFTNQSPRGEFTLVVAGHGGDEESWSEERLRAELKTRLKGEGAPSRIASQVASESGWVKSKVYELLLEMKGRSKS